MSACTGLVDDMAIQMYITECSLRIHQHSAAVVSASRRISSACHRVVGHNILRGADKFERLVASKINQLGNP